MHPLRASGLLAAAAASLAAAPKGAVTIEFFGSGGMDPGAVRGALPFHDGDEVKPSAMKSWRAGARDAVLKATGRPATDVAFVCCNEGAWTVYIGLGGTTTVAPSYRAAPSGSARLPAELVRLDAKISRAWEKAVRNGRSGEEHSTGYALSADRDLRSEQLELRELALRHEQVILDVLATSANSSHRAAAAFALGYVRQSPAQIDALVQAASDPDAEVRNNAVRALGVMADARPELRRAIPPDVFIGLLRSGVWSDRNKGLWILVELTRDRDPALLEKLRKEALESLVEMARWKDPGHAYAPRVLLGRIGGLEETRLQKLAAEGPLEEILRSVGDIR